MNCPKFEETLALAEGPLHEQVDAPVLAHLVQCRECRETFIGVRQAMAALQQPVTEVDEDSLAVTLIRRMIGRTSRAGTRRRRALLSQRRTAGSATSIWIGALAGAAAAVVVFLALVAVTSMPGGGSPDSHPSAGRPEPQPEPERFPREGLEPVVREPQAPPPDEFEEPVREEIPRVEPPGGESDAPPREKPATEPERPGPQRERVPPTQVRPRRDPPRPVVARVVKVHGRVTSDSHPKGLELGTVIQWEDVLRTAAGSKVALRLPDGGWMYINESSRLRFDPLEEGGTQVDLLEGAVYFDLPHQEAVFRVLAGPERVHVLGTSFMVRRRDGRTRLVVESGAVRFSNALGQVRVPQGYASVADKDGWPSNPERVDVGKELDWVSDLAEVLVREDFRRRRDLESRWRFIREAPLSVIPRLNRLALKITNPDREIRVAGMVTRTSFEVGEPLRIRAQIRVRRIRKRMSLNVGFARAASRGLGGESFQWSRIGERERLRIRKAGRQFSLWVGGPSFKEGDWSTVEVILGDRWMSLSLNGKEVARELYTYRPIRGEVQAGLWVYTGEEGPVEVEVRGLLVERVR